MQFGHEELAGKSRIQLGDISDRARSPVGKEFGMAAVTFFTKNARSEVKTIHNRNVD